MAELARIGIAINEELLARFDMLISGRGYANRSEVPVTWPRLLISTADEFVPPRFPRLVRTYLVCAVAVSDTETNATRTNSFFTWSPCRSSRQ